MLYLLQSRDDQKYVVFIRTDDYQGFLNQGHWTLIPPRTEQELKIEESYEYLDINWWQLRYRGYGDGKIVKKFKTLDDYKQWVLDYPEYFL